MRVALALLGLAVPGILVARRAPSPPRPTGEIALDAARPVIDAIVAGVPLRLRVDPNQGGYVELNPAAAARLPIRYGAALDEEVGRVTLKGRDGAAVLRVGSVERPVLVAEHGRDIAADADGIVGPGVLPYAIVRWRNAAAPAPVAERALPLEDDDASGLSAAAPELAGGIRVRLTFLQPVSSATGAAGALLAADRGGRWAGDARPIPIAFGLSRPARPMAFDRPPTIAGFRFAVLPVRDSDFRGHGRLPGDPADRGDIVVARRAPPQHGEAWVTIGADRLAACRELRFDAIARTLTLACASG